METTGQQLVDHWNWAAEKGLMNKNTASGRRSACVQVLSILPDWQNVDVSQLNVEDILLRFQNLKKKDFRPNVLEVYKKRFKVALDSYLEYLRDPGNWRASSQERQASTATGNFKTSAKRSTARRTTVESDTEDLSAAITSAGMTEYKFPLRTGIVVKLFLPTDLSPQDVQRLTGFLNMLVVE
jgi:hypothetical protein